jgi:hypothetical protein
MIFISASPYLYLTNIVVGILVGLISATPSLGVLSMLTGYLMILLSEEVYPCG